MTEVELDYGKYTPPKTLEKIIALQNELTEWGLLKYRDLLGFYFSLDGVSRRYLNTPLDVISFALPGADGIHYGFLTEFSQVESLEEAYIVRVSPMDFDEPVKIIARNLEDFVRILCFHPSALFLVEITTSEERSNRLGQQYLAVSLSRKKNMIKQMHKKFFKMNFS